MASLYERLLGVHPSRPKIPVHQFQSLVAEWARGEITGAEAQAAVEHLSDGTGLDSTEQQEAQDLLATVPTGTTADAKASRALRGLEIDQVFLLADNGTPPYDDPQAIRDRLGVPTR